MKTRLPVPDCFSRALAGVLVFGCLGVGSGSAASPPNAVASIKPVHSLLSAIMAGVAEPRLIIRGAASPHTFTFRPSDAAALRDADIIFMIGDKMETALSGPVGALGGKAHVVKLAEIKGLIRLPLRAGGAFEEDDHRGHGEHEHEDDHGDDEHDDHGDEPFDTHVWLDPVNAFVMANAMAETLGRFDPANAGRYKTNLEALLERLDALTAEIAAKLAPARGKRFIVFHDSYRYFEDRFGLKASGSIAVSLQRTPGVRRIRQLRRKVRKFGVVCVFDEPQFDSRVIGTITEGADVRTGTVDPLGAGIADGPGLYFTLLRNMAKSFRDCLAPAGN